MTLSLHWKHRVPDSPWAPTNSFRWHAARECLTLQTVKISATIVKAQAWVFCPRCKDDRGLKREEEDRYQEEQAQYFMHCTVCSYNFVFNTAEVVRFK